ncbi:hypothetical protein [Streptomyces geranii]|uniref:hypothetical protein n=1 Tax=Streptomyces geranii TaxID=2058923 RepID=UPI0038CDC46F
MYWVTRRHFAGDHGALTERIGDTLVGLGRRMWPTATLGESDLAEITAPSSTNGTPNTSARPRRTAS